MTDREKVIEGLQDLAEYLFHEYKVCYDGDADDYYERFLQADNALTLLKDPDRVKVVRCKDCCYWEPENAEEGDCSGHCRNAYATCQNQQTDMNWFCADGERKEGR